MSSLALIEQPYPVDWVKMTSSLAVVNKLAA